MSFKLSQPITPALQPSYMKVFIQRDYSEGTSVRFNVNRFPIELESRVSILSNLKKLIFKHNLTLLYTHSWPVFV